MRISIIGLPGSGKTTVAEQISKKLSVPHIHLDRFWFEAGGLHIDPKVPSAELDDLRAEIRRKTEEAISIDSWVSDGLYPRVQSLVADRADQILFLDIPLWQRLLNHATRIFKPSKRHSELSFWNELSFFVEIIRRQYTAKPKLLAFVDQYAVKIVRLRSRKAIEEYIANY